MDELYTKLKTFGKVKLNEPMSKHTTFKIGGPARYFVTVQETDKLVELLNYLSGEGIAYYILGGGSNILFQDSEFDGVVIKIINHKSKIIPTGHQYSLINQMIEVESGVLLGAVMGLAMQNGLSGMEWSAGIPGTVGGAVRGNAGAFGQSTSDVLEKVEVWQDGEVMEMTKEECQFVYRGSIFKNNKNLVILRAWFRLEKTDKKEVLFKMQEVINARKGKYPIYPSAGCFFTNFDIEKWPGDKSELPPIFIERGKVPAGWMIDQLGFKGKELGGASVGTEHCNFIVNKNKATQSEILELMAQIKEKVYNRYGVELEIEVEIVK
ncbi:UDP-N-acetylmuramate dehydrogenase [Patescibacteria group bacterium]|nr:UDP-N-acetylmuramate dehydrogenase [Patescibacteria group bacterium]